ncbi:uncharacterized protein LAESUDRAFT_756814 [Laetiporus sulphureus 93-53]|uniref:Uncharacterized protein n=1 Tax=Laetiporus sulphureus 93-53 TaxID=1314785 RepID=A0A165FM01_9APHY|nr:uncharacterized protein LAESUDRAFT_756814 [Laetiporus sulphureus 93-53]KZT09172.1 hypothetical protein LAESUDRAFT_756814 [Laetiporus sulphureus 93-53]
MDDKYERHGANWSTFLTIRSLLPHPMFFTTGMSDPFYVIRSRPRRETRESSRAEHRRDVLGLPGPVDIWVAANTQEGADRVPDLPLADNEVRCEVQMRFTPGPKSDGSYDNSDQDTYILHLTVTGRPHGPFHAADSFAVVLEEYKGWPSSLDAPDWAKWPPGRTVIFRQTVTKVANAFQTMFSAEEAQWLVDRLHRL